MTTISINNRIHIMIAYIGVAFIDTVQSIDREYFVYHGTRERERRGGGREIKSRFVGS